MYSSLPRSTPCRSAMVSNSSSLEYASLYLLASAHHTRCCRSSRRQKEVVTALQALRALRPRLALRLRPQLPRDSSLRRFAPPSRAFRRPSRGTEPHTLGLGAHNDRAALLASNPELSLCYEQVGNSEW